MKKAIEFSVSIAVRTFKFHDCARTGDFLEIEELTVEGLSKMIQEVHTNPSYRARARYFQKVIAQLAVWTWQSPQRGRCSSSSL
jgi:hypothetical protein